MNTKFQYDANSNTLILNNKKQMKGFVITIANSKEEAEKFKNGEQQQIHLVPIFAPSLEVAIEELQKNGKVVLNSTPYELLELQISLLNQIAKEQNIEIIKDNSMYTTEFKK